MYILAVIYNRIYDIIYSVLRILSTYMYLNIYTLKSIYKVHIYIYYTVQEFSRPEYWNG